VRVADLGELQSSDPTLANIFVFRVPNKVPVDLEPVKIGYS